MIFNAHTNSMSISTIPIFEMHRLEATWVRSCRLPRVLKLSRDSAVDNLNCLQVLSSLRPQSVALSNKSCDEKKEKQKFIGGWSRTWGQSLSLTQVLTHSPSPRRELWFLGGLAGGRGPVGAWVGGLLNSLFHFLDALASLDFKLWVGE